MKAWFCTILLCHAPVLSPILGGSGCRVCGPSMASASGVYIWEEVFLGDLGHTSHSRTLLPTLSGTGLPKSGPGELGWSWLTKPQAKVKQWA